MGRALSGRVAASDEQIRELFFASERTFADLPLHKEGCSTFARTDVRFSADATAPSRSSSRRLPGFTLPGDVDPLFSGPLSTP